MDINDDLYATSPTNSDISICSNSTTSSMNDDELYITKPKKSGKKKKNRRQKFQQYIREETNIFEILNQDTDMYNDFNPKNHHSDNNEIELKNEMQEKFYQFQQVQSRIQ